ncbi:MAG: DNA alkylation repair protein [Desulfatibacillaceae bacterium]
MTGTTRAGVRDMVERLERLASAEDATGKARFGIRGARVLGIRMPELQAMARDIGTDHGLALDLWKTGIHEARILAALVDDPGLVDEAQLEAWVGDFDSWDLCDQCCGKLFDRTALAWDKAAEWAGRKPEFERRAGYVLMAQLAVHDRKAPDSAFDLFFPLIQSGANDGRNFVKKAVNWALRQIGKRNVALNAKAVECAGKLRDSGDATARWIASDALRELTSPAVQDRLWSREGK